MAFKSVKTLGNYIKPTILDKGIGAQLPEAYKKFYKEWKLTEPTAVHYIPESGKWKRDDVTGEVTPIQNIPIPTFLPKEANDHIWGGEEVVQGFEVRKERRRRVPHFWVPILRRTVVYSEVLNKYMSVIVTDRAINLINAHYGFDHYLLKTPACDLKSLLPLVLKRKILQELDKGCPAYADRPEKQEQILKRYQGYLAAYTREEIEWYGYSFDEACKIWKDKMEAENQKKIVPLKHVFRSQLIESLKAASSSDSLSNPDRIEAGDTGSSASWLEKINPFGKKRET
ncbi:mitochondrial ribosomal protein L28 [Leptinotarsa decemlineata]|uniref:mitochondrial ribosomal protein L28 n=1 Tax=Leptinotarsa decemlineata TaxID=7539 RepID=UPI003D30C9BB